MQRSILRSLHSRLSFLLVQRNTFLTNDYKCADAWNDQTKIPVSHKVNLSDFYNILEQNYNSKGVISAIDVDVFANSIKDSLYLEELKDLLHKLRMSSETINTLESTHSATVRKYIEFGQYDDLLSILKDPLNYGLFLDFYSANILLDELIKVKQYEKAANVAALIMLQEDYTNDITNSLCQYASYNYIANYIPPEPEISEEPKKKVEEVKIRIKFLRNPFHDDHFDLKDTYLLAGKTLAWISEIKNDNLSDNLQLIGWFVYKKYNKLLNLIELMTKKSNSKIFKEVIDLMKKELVNVDETYKNCVENCLTLLEKIEVNSISLNEALQNSIENAINKRQIKDIATQKQIFKDWMKLREVKFEEQMDRLNRAKRVQIIKEKQSELEVQEQKLWFFDNEEKMDLQIEEKEKLVERTSAKTSADKKSDEDYIPPEILPQRK